MPYILISLSLVLITTVIFSYRPIIVVISQKKATPYLESAVFFNGGMTKSEVLKTIHSITNNRFNDDFILDYFYKIKGHQLIKSNKSSNFWIKTYLSSPTKIKLNYFEQVHFYKAFLNHGKTNEAYSKTEANNTLHGLHRDSSRKKKTEVIG